MSDLIKLAPGALVVGKPLPWTVFDENGARLLNQGHVIQNDDQLEKLYKRGLFQAPVARARAENDEDRQEGRRISPFAEYAPLLDELETGLDAVVSQKEGAKKKVLNLARHINEMCNSDPDASIALVHIYAVEPSAYEQTLFYAILCNFIGKELGYSPERGMILMAAALTANIALLPHQDKLNNSKMQLTADQRAIVNRHPLLSVAALTNAGIGQKRFLKVIAQHHERFDGSGYPEGLTGDRILPEAKALALAERYTAMVTQRAYRDRFCSDQARDEILASVGGDTDQSVYTALFEAMGDYPPGALVRLRNGETAVVTRQSRNKAPPRVKAVISATGNPYMGGIRRHSEDPEYAIDEIINPEVLPALSLTELWGYT